MQVDVLNTTSLSLAYVLGGASGSEKVRRNPHCKDRGGSDKPLIAQA